MLQPEPAPRRRPDSEEAQITMINRNPIITSAEGPASVARLLEIVSDPNRLPEWSSLAKKVGPVTGDTLEVEGPEGRELLSYAYDSGESRLVVRAKRDTFPLEYLFRFRNEAGKVRIEAEIHPGGECTDKERSTIEQVIRTDLGRLIEKSRG